MSYFQIILLDDEERVVTAELVRQLSSRRNVEIEKPTVCDVDFNLTTDMQRNGDFSSVMKIRNTSPESRKIDVHLTALSCRYTGISTSELKDATSATVLEPNAGIMTLKIHFILTILY